MLTFPRRTGPAIVDWVDYADAVHRADPNAFAADVVRRAGTTHHVWMVWEPMYQTFGVKCETDRHGPAPDRRPRTAGEGATS